MLEITLKGPRGSGKTTFSQFIKEEAERMGYSVILNDAETAGIAYMTILPPKE